MQLAKIIEHAACNGLHTQGAALDRVVTSITLDSRQCNEGTLFIALKGAAQDGAAFIPDALARGCRMILAQDATLSTRHTDPAITWLITDDVRHAAAAFAAAFYTPKPGHLMAVTGTNGKTSTVHFCRQLLHYTGAQAASIGTLGIITHENTLWPNTEGLTTPDVIRLHQWLQQLAQQGVSHVAMEASSHGLHQQRMGSLDISVAGFTNLSRDHLDYHGSMDAYLQAKLLLFTEVLSPHGAAVINADTAVSSSVIAAAEARGARVLTYGRSAQDILLHSATPTPRGQHVSFSFMGQRVELEVPLIGDFQIENILCAAGMVHAAGIPRDTVIEGLAHVSAVPGRMQIAAHHAKGGAIIVDYAHTPDALERVLIAARPHVDAKAGGTLHVVFGCGGDRDPGKRPMMGKVATQLADNIVVTDDNPRTEHPAAIRKAIMEACINAEEISDRADAIQHSVNKMQAGDVLVIAGKGHEQVQIVGDVRTPFDDVHHAQLAAKALG